MKTLIPYLFVIVALAVFSGRVMGQHSSTTASAKVAMLDIIKLTKVEDMNFGKMIGGTTGTVELTTSGTRTATGVTTVGETDFAPAKFEVRGTNDYEYSIQLPSDVTIKNGDDEMVINHFVAKTSTASENGLIGIVKADSYFIVGGKLIVASPTLPVGLYQSNFEVSVGYN